MLTTADAENRGLLEPQSRLGSIALSAFRAKDEIAKKSISYSREIGICAALCLVANVAASPCCTTTSCRQSDIKSPFIIPQLCGQTSQTAPHHLMFPMPALMHVQGWGMQEP